MIPNRDPNAPPDPSELRVIPSTQQWPVGVDPTNPVMAGDPPPGSPASPDTWTGQGDNVPADEQEPGESALPPELTSINPTNSNHASQVINAYGTRFTNNTILVFNGVEQDTTFQSATNVKASVDKPSADTFDVWLRDIGGDSAHLSFQFTGTEKEAPAKKK